MLWSIRDQPLVQTSVVLRDALNLGHLCVCPATPLRFLAEIEERVRGGRLRVLGESCGSH
jgi:hypothetical protein